MAGVLGKLSGVKGRESGKKRVWLESKFTSLM
jgi:hypothetical protein